MKLLGGSKQSAKLVGDIKKLSTDLINYWK